MEYDTSVPENQLTRPLNIFLIYTPSSLVLVLISFHSTMNAMIFQLSRVVEALREEAGLHWKYVAIVVFIYLLLPRPTYKTNVKVPTVKFMSPWLPGIISRLLFNSNAPSVIYDGYSKVRPNSLTIIAGCIINTFLV